MVTFSRGTYNKKSSKYVRSKKSWWQVRVGVGVRIGVLDCSIGGQNIKKNLACQQTLLGALAAGLVPQGERRESQVARRLCKISRLFYIYSYER